MGELTQGELLIRMADGVVASFTKRRIKRRSMDSASFQGRYIPLRVVCVGHLTGDVLRQVDLIIHQRIIGK